MADFDIDPAKSEEKGNNFDKASEFSSGVRIIGRGRRRAPPGCSWLTDTAPLLSSSDEDVEFAFNACRGYLKRKAEVRRRASAAISDVTRA